MRRASFIATVALSTRLAYAQEPPPLVPPPVAELPPAPKIDAATTPRARLQIALRRFEFGDYASVASDLESLVESGATTKVLAPADRLEALRAYGIACALLGRTTAAQGAFLLLLEADPGAKMDPAFVRPEAVAIFDAVRDRNRATLREAYTRGRGRRYAVLNLLPPAGQLQNHDYAKGYSLLGVELALLALDVTTGSLLYEWHGSDQTFGKHADAARALRPVNWVSFGALLAVAVYGIIDGFVVGHRRARQERDTLEQLGSSRAASFARTLALDGGGVGLHF